jgi:hypothetical protein
MSLRRAPTASLRPISRVRSVTDTSMMFMMLMPPTTSDTDAIAAKSQAIVVVEARCAAIAAAGLLTWKSLSASPPERWRWRSSASIWPCAERIASSDTALTRM